jgi:hypothetical protein
MSHAAITAARHAQADAFAALDACLARTAEFLRHLQDRPVRVYSPRVVAEIEREFGELSHFHPGFDRVLDAVEAPGVDPAGPYEDDYSQLAAVADLADEPGDRWDGLG